MFCVKCGTTLDSQDDMCPRCGHATANAAPRPQSSGTRPSGSGRPRGRMPEGSFSSFMNFEVMITPMIMKGFFAIGSALTIIGWLAFMFTMGLGGFFGGLIAMPISLLLFRVVCEQMILFFTMNKHLREVRDELRR